MPEYRAVVQWFCYWQPDCDPCMEKKPLVAEIARELGVTVVWYDASAPANRPWVERHRVKTVPAVIMTYGAGVRLAGLTGNLITEDALKTLTFRLREQT